MIITIEGGNGSGKQTQTALLSDRLIGSGRSVARFSYPQYETHTGQVILDYLHGEFGAKEDLVEFAALLYARDRAANLETYQVAIENGGIILNDRYKESSWAILGSLKKDMEKRRYLIDWMRQLESAMPDSDLVILLDMPWEYASGLIDAGRVANGRAKDEHEVDLDFLQRCEQTYRELAEQYGWSLIDCVRAGHVRSREEIAAEIWALVSEAIDAA